MKKAVKWCAGSATDPGLQRTINEDRLWCDAARGVFLVVDGLGGHAAGEIAAAAAVDVVRQNIKPDAQDLEDNIRNVICAANNEIYRLSEENAAWRGMACVMTLAVMRDDQAVIGHVGDSRLYLFWNGKLKKITSDHSPVGEQEDQGLLTEEEAMYHPRRNEVFRDVGSLPRLRDDEEFIEIRKMTFREDAALMLCSDGLTDCVPSPEITKILERFDGDPDKTAQLLVEAANGAGGKDNISVVFVAGSEFAGAESQQSQGARSRHATTRARLDSNGEKSKSGIGTWLKYFLILVIAVALGVGIWQWIEHMTSVPPRQSKPVVAEGGHAHTIDVNSADARGIIDALSTAVSGDTVLVPPGEFLGPLLLKDGVSIVAKDPRSTVVRSDPAATADEGIAIVARGVQKSIVNGLRIAADDTHPLKTGILLVDSSVELVNLDISGAVFSGIRMEGVSNPRIEACFIHSNGGAGVAIGDTSAPTLVRNQIMQNGLMVNAVRPGIEIGPAAKPLLEGNLVSGNGADEPLKTGQTETGKRGAH